MKTGKGLFRVEMHSLLYVPVRTIVSPCDANCVTPFIYPTTDLDFLFGIIEHFIWLKFLFFIFWNLHTPFLGHRSQRLQWPIVITRCPSSVCRLSSVVRRPLDYLHFRLLLQNRLMDFDETWYGWSTQGALQVLLFFGQIRPGADPGRGKNRSQGVPFFRKTSSSEPDGYSNKTECIAVI